MSHTANNRKLTNDEVRAMLEYAITIERYLTDHAFYAFSAMGIKRSPSEQAALYILEKLKQIILLKLKTPKTPKTDLLTIDHQELYQKCRGRYDTIQKLDKGLNVLVMRNYIRVKEIPVGEQGGRPKKIIEINPDLLDGTSGVQSDVKEHAAVRKWS